MWVLRGRGTIFACSILIVCEDGAFRPELKEQLDDWCMWAGYISETIAIFGVRGSLHEVCFHLLEVNHTWDAVMFTESFPDEHHILTR